MSSSDAMTLGCATANLTNPSSLGPCIRVVVTVPASHDAPPLATATTDLNTYLLTCCSKKMKTYPEAEMDELRRSVGLPPNPIRLQCQRCKYIWNYQGKKKHYV